jgi:hypothetical protein
VVAVSFSVDRLGVGALEDGVDEVFDLTVGAFKVGPQAHCLIENVTEEFLS